MTEILESNKFGRIQIDDIVQFESDNEIEFPVDYRNFLITNNGGKPKQNLVPSVNSDVQWIFGMVNEPYYASLFQHIDMFHKRIPSWYFPIANDSAGNLYLMSMYIENRGLIAFWKHEEETDGNAEQFFDNMSFVANSFTDFLDQLTNKL
jgi:hypothetical protein